MNKRVFVVLVTLAIGVFGPISFAQATQPVTVKYGTTHWGEPGWQEYISWAKQVFEARNPGIRIEVVDLRKAATLQTALASLDVLDFPFQQAGILAQLHILADLRPFLTQANLERFLPVTYGYVRAGQPLFGLPLWVEPTVILYRHGDSIRRAIFQTRAGIIGTAQWSWDALGNFAMAITRHYNDDRIPEVAGFQAYWQFLDVAYHQMGGLYDGSAYPPLRINDSMFVMTTSRVLHPYLDYDRPFSYPIPFGEQDKDWFGTGTAAMRLGTTRDLWELKDVPSDQYEVFPLPKPDASPAIWHPQARSGGPVEVASVQLVASSARKAGGGFRS